MRGSLNNSVALAEPRQVVHARVGLLLEGHVQDAVGETVLLEVVGAELDHGRDRVERVHRLRLGVRAGREGEAELRLDDGNRGQAQAGARAPQGAEEQDRLHSGFGSVCVLIREAVQIAFFFRRLTMESPECTPLVILRRYPMATAQSAASSAILKERRRGRLVEMLMHLL